MRNKYSVFSLIKNALSYHENWQRAWKDPAPKKEYDAVIVGGGGHGLATAYYLAKKHNMNNIAVVEKGWIGGVDISPIADCTKSQVWEMGKNLGILKEIVDAQPTDGLWDDGRTDINQLGMSYRELEEAMKDSSNKNHKKYLEIRKRNLHKINPIPVCKMKDD